MKELYGSAVQCAMPACTEPLYLLADDGCSRTLNSQVCHIVARRAGGARWDPAMSAEQNAGFDNLVLMCHRHAFKIDQPDQVQRYPVAVLKEFKAQQVAVSISRGQCWSLSEQEAEAVRTASFEVQVQARDIHLGGAGGAALGAGGGGGGAVGPGAVGGAGGPGGRIHLSGGDGAAPGAGGGGAGYLAPDARPWTAGSGPAGRVGAAHVPGFDGLAGGASSFSTPGQPGFVFADGGSGALAGSGVRISSVRVGVSSVMLVRSAEVVDGLGYVLGGAWSRTTLLNLPDVIRFGVLLVLEAGGASAGEYTIRIAARGPHGATTVVVAFPLCVTEPGDVLRHPMALPVQVRLDAFGLWTLLVTSEHGVLTEHPFLVERYGSAPTSPATDPH